MSARPHRLLALLCILLLAACAGPAKIAAPLHEGDKADHVIILLSQSEVAVDDVDLNAGGGLIGALIETAIESKMTSNRQSALAPLRDALLDYRFETKLAEALRARLPTGLVKSDASVKVLHDEASFRAHLQTVVPANVFVIKPRYAFGEEFSVAYVNAEVMLSTYLRAPPDEQALRKMPASARKSYKPLLLHSGHFRSQFVVPAAAETRIPKGVKGYRRFASAWALDDAVAVRTAFARSVDEIADLIRRDGERELPILLRHNLVRVRMGAGQFSASLFEQRDQRSLLKFSDTYFWIDDQQISK